MEIKYFIGIDFGHGETCVSRVPGYDNEEVSRILLRKGLAKDQKVLSALYKKDDTWHLVFSKEDFKQSNLYEGFKGPIHRLKKDNPSSLYALKEFGKLIFSTILKNDTDLKYIPSTGEANFVICIANPSQWRNDKDHPTVPYEYLEFFKTECGIKPAILCINESDAAFYTKFSKFESDYSNNDTVFVIDLGSSTIDFTTYNNSKCIIDGCWGLNLGAHIIEDKILALGLPQNREKLRRAELLRKEKGITGNLNVALSLLARKAKEDFYTNLNEESVFELIVRMRDLIPALKPTAPEATEEVFEIVLEKDDFDKVIAEYKSQLDLTIKNAAELLHNKVMKTPQFVVLSGGASRMDFVEELTRKHFPTAQIDVDQTPEWVVSNGAAKYIKAQQQALEDLIDKVKSIDYKSLYRDADITATQKATQILMPYVISRITGSTDLTGLEILQYFCDFFNGLNSKNERYVAIFHDTANSLLKDKISQSLKEIIFESFKVDVDCSDILLKQQFDVYDFHPTFFAHEDSYDGPGRQTIKNAIFNAAECVFSFTWNRIRGEAERKKIADGCQKRLSVRDPFGVQLNEENLEISAENLRNQAVKIAENLFHEKELFRTSNYK